MLSPHICNVIITNMGNIFPLFANISLHIFERSISSPSRDGENMEVLIYPGKVFMSHNIILFAIFWHVSLRAHLPRQRIKIAKRTNNDIEDEN